MKTLLRFFWRARGYWLERAAKKEIGKLKNGEYSLPYNIPYVSQYASKELAESYVKNSELLASDPKWRDFAAETIKEYAFWARRICGMACFKMILGALGNPVAKLDLPLIILAKQAMVAGCYLLDPKNPKRLIGLLHKPFLKFVNKFGLIGKLIWYIEPAVIAQEILNKNFIIASVSHEIRYAGARPKDKTGHLVLVHGFKIDGGKITGFFIHNPSGFYGISQENHFVPVEDFINCFSGRIIVLKKK